MLFKKWHERLYMQINHASQASPGSMVSVASSCESIPVREPIVASSSLPAVNYWKLNVWEDDARRRKRLA